MTTSSAYPIWNLLKERKSFDPTLLRETCEHIVSQPPCTTGLRMSP